VQAQLLDPYPGQLVVACSGGADSLALAHLAIMRAAKRGEPMPVLAHINHGLRPEAAQEAQAVKRFATAHGARCLVREVALCSEGASLEARARDARYSALDACASEVGAAWIVFAHTQSDQAETVLMRIVRGTGLVGLAGMSATRGIYARPLLGVTRQDTEAYCERNSLVYSSDPMNRESRFTRVRIRHQWLPELRKENPRVQQALCGLADSARDHREVLDWAAHSVLRDLQIGARLQLGEAFQALPEALAARVISLFLEGQGARPLERSHILALVDLCRAPVDGSRRLSVPGGEVVRIYNELAWEFADSPRSESDSLDVPDGFLARRWQPGDRMRPTRLKGRSRKLSDLYADAKVPAAGRPIAWVVTTEAGEIVWAQHLGHAHGWDLPVKVIQAAEQVPE
tara:strand:- start:22147 stop:23349 length:1203 start_codon:yes stop_codon:yes gene_type:complete